MDELTIDGKVYVSSKKAAALSGYAKDYVGQLCREGRVDSKLVGRSWYVYEPSIREHRFADERSKGKNALETEAENNVETSENTNIQAIWERPSYTPEEVTPLPDLEESVEETLPAKKQDLPSETLLEMQSAWQDWFSSEQKGTHEAAPIKNDRFSIVEAPESEETKENSIKDQAESVPVRMIVSDIEPVRPYKTVEAPISYNTEPYLASQKTSVTTRREVRTKRSRMNEREEVRAYAVPVKASLIALIVLVISVTIISTGVIDELHLVGNAESGILQFLQGNTIVEK